MSTEIDPSRSTRKPRPEVAVYRPGSGPLKKSSNNTENIQSSSSNKITRAKAEMKNDFVSQMRNVTLNDHKAKEQSKFSDVSVAGEPKSKRYSTQKQERDAHKQNVRPDTTVNDNMPPSSGRSSTPQLKRPNNLCDKPNSGDSGSSQDLRQLLLEKRQLKNKDSQGTACDKFQQGVSKMENTNNGTHNKKSSNISVINSGKDSDVRNPRRRSSKKTLEAESRERHSTFKFEELSNSKLKEDKKPANDSNKRNDKEEFAKPKSPDGPPKGSRRKRRNNRHGSRRGSVSSDRTTPVPELSWADDVSERSLPPRSGSRQSFHRHTPSPHRSNSRSSRCHDDRSQTASPSPFSRPPATPLPKQSPPNAPKVVYYQQANYATRDNRSIERDFGRPPSGRGVRQDRLPSNFDSLPPRLRKKYEEERLVSGHATQPNHPKDDWDGGSLTFSSANRLPHSQSFPAAKNKIPTKSGRAIVGAKASHYFHEHEDSDVSVPRPRSQDSVDRERKMSFNDSRSSTPSSSVEFQPSLKGNLRRLDEISPTQTSLDWGEEMEEEDRRSLAGESKYHLARKMEPVQFSSTDIRYQNKPVQGYVVIPDGAQPEGRIPDRRSISEDSKQQQVKKMESLQFASTDIRYQNTPAQGYVVVPNGAQPTGRPLLGQGRLQEAKTDSASPRMPIPGLIQLPPQPERHSPRRSDSHSVQHRGPARHLEARLNDPTASYRKPSTQRTLFDPSNPNKPILVASRDEVPSSHVQQLLPCPEAVYQSLPTDQGNSSGKPAWYDTQSESFRTSKCPPLLMDIVRCDMDLSWLLQGPGIHQKFERIEMNRDFIKKSLRTLLTIDLRFCQMENVEQHMWKLGFHNVIEALRKTLAEDSENKDIYKNLLFAVIDDGTAYFESLLDVLQETYNFCLDTFLEPQPYPMLSGLGYVGLAVISCQKILVFLGDLARYRELTAETSNYGRAKSWYMKANLANPKNGRPYNQLAILALYARRKLDAVYLYMRSLMASNPFQSARESLVSLFDENRKKYELQERKRKDAKEANSRRRSTSLSDAALVDRRGLRREIWIHPSDGHRTRRMTSASATSDSSRAFNSDDEELTQLPSIEVNKRFVTSYLNVQGKLYTKIGMETFQECGLQMLREFRALLQHTPLPVKQDRLLQLLALNMFAVSNTQLKDARMAGGCRSAWQECALIVSLEMFNVLLERCNALLKDQLDNQTANNRLLGEDLQIILPAIKVWCDWLLCHSLVWNPPPNSRDYHVGPPGTPWTRLATLINLLSKFDTRQVDISAQPKEGYEAVKLPEDVALCGFTPLMLNIQEPHYASKTSDKDMAADCVRIERLLYFGRDFLCGLDPPVLKLKLIAPTLSEYVSVVEAAGANNNISQQSSDEMPEDDNSDDEALLDQLEREEALDVIVNEGEEDAVGNSGAGAEAAAAPDDAPGTTPESATDDAKFRELRQRKDELTQRHREHERRKQQLRAILQERVQIELEVRPKYLVADTNCYIDHLADLVRLTRDKFYTLVAPLVVLNELDGLCRSRLASEARSALAFLREKNPQVRYVTSKGAPLPTFAAGTMTEESDDQGLTNDDRILQCCLSLIKPSPDEEGHARDGVRKLRCEVVLLTDDRNLRVKALSRDVPVRDLPAFVAWSCAAP